MTIAPEVEVAPSSTRQAPWRRLGTDVSGAESVQEALEAAGLNWDVTKKPIFTAPGAIYDDASKTWDVAVEPNQQRIVNIPNRYAVERSDNQDVLGIVGGDYQLFQNHQALEFANALIDQDVAELEFDTAGELRGGRWVWLALKISGDILVADEDPIGRNLVVATSHDGSKAIQAFLSHIRIICENTLNMAIRSAAHRWTVRHTASLDGRIAEARRALQLTFRYDEEFTELMNHLAEQSFNQDAYERLCDDLIPKQHQVRDALKKHWDGTTTLDSALKSTRYGALQLVTEFYDWGREGRDPHAQTMSTWVGNAYRMRNRALTLLTEEAA